jgi:glycosyltransferase involved in cell wall biosynthesis
MRIAFYINSLSQGGAERVVSILASYWAAKGHGVAVITAARSRDFYVMHPAVQRLYLGAEGAPAFGSGLRANLRRVMELRGKLRAFRPDTAIAMMDTANVVLACAGLRLSGISRLGSERVYAPSAPMSQIWSLLRRWSYGFLDGIVVQSKDSASWVLNNTWARRAFIVPNPLSLPLLRQEPVVAPSSVAAEFQYRLIAVGRLERQKGFDLLLEAFARIMSSTPEWALVIVGEGSQRKALELQVRSLGLAHRAFVVGNVGNIGDWYTYSDLFVLPSRFEGFPNALLEALGHGLPVVSFDCQTGPSEIVRHGVDGLLVEKENVDGLAAALVRMMEDRALRGACARRAGEAAERFSVGRVAGLWEMAIREAKT